MFIARVQKLSLIDYPGKIACTVFLAGCCFRCPFCYNRELVLPEETKHLSRVPEQEFFGFLKEKKGLLEGVCIGGGEATIDEDLIGFCRRIKELEFSIKLDTNGSNPKMLKELIDKRLIDYIALDVKAPKEKYLKVIGIEDKLNLKGYKLNFLAKRIIKNIEESINIVKEGKVEYEFRTTLVPKLLSKKDILKIVKWIGPAKRYFLQNFRPEKTVDPDFENFKPRSKKYLLETQKAVAPFFEICLVRD